MNASGNYIVNDEDIKRSRINAFLLHLKREKLKHKYNKKTGDITVFNIGLVRQDELNSLIKSLNK